mgnify:CR=1 FL=1
MVEAVTLMTLQGTAPRQVSQAAVAASSAPPAQSSDGEFVSSYIRIDNLQNVVILEYRSSKTGEVVDQFPTQAQISAFKHAEQAAAPAAPSTAPAPAPEAASAPAAPANTTQSVLA